MQNSLWFPGNAVDAEVGDRDAALKGVGPAAGLAVLQSSEKII